MAGADPLLRIISRSDAGPADALSKAFRAARGTLIRWLNPDYLSLPGAFAGAIIAFSEIPEWLMIFRKGKQFNEETNLIQRYPTLPPSVNLSGFQSLCFICQPAVVFRRSMVCS